MTMKGENHPCMGPLSVLMLVLVGVENVQLMWHDSWKKPSDGTERKSEEQKEDVCLHDRCYSVCNNDKVLDG